MLVIGLIALSLRAIAFFIHLPQMDKQLITCLLDQDKTPL
jgi:hypothetical protein